ncbi:MAG: hypothetical protein COB20_11675 [SAR86 cluster bacterium]|uniref:Insulinase family protein n=1 Tax=SAR86 cluster bacterium TaxID=2030880 RepID=A0A2A4X0D7_9GAMM|nr:MAG: hypothetical protein COB20_11675 [SAR86 cluster bacterium]
MKSFLSVRKVFFAALCFSVCAAFSLPAFAQELVELKLPNSNKVVIKLMFKNGSISDEPGKEGVNQAVSELVVQGGTRELSYSDIQDRIYPMAARYGVNSDKEVTVFSFEVHQDYLNEFYPILKGLILTPRFSEDDFSRVMVNQQNYVDQVIRASSDEDYSKVALEDLLFRGNNYQHMKQGTSEGVGNITLVDVREHYQRLFTKNNLTIGIAGNYSDGFLQQLVQDMAALPDTTPVLPEPGVARMPNGIEIEIVAKEGAFGSVIFTGFPLNLTRADDDFAALMVANSYFGEHRKSYSRLYEKIREQRSMNYGDYSYIEWYENGGRNMLPPSGVPRSSNYFSMWVRPVQIATQLRQQYPELADIEIGHAHFALRMIVKELAVLVESGLSAEDFEATRDFLLSYTKLYAQTPSSRLGYLMDSKFYGRDDYLLELDQLLKTLTLEDVNQAIRKYWQTDNMFVTIITDVSEAQPLADSLLNNLASPMSYSNVVREGLSEALQQEDALVADFPLNITSVKVVDSKDTFQ